MSRTGQESGDYLLSQYRNLSGYSIHTHLAQSWGAGVPQPVEHLSIIRGNVGSILRTTQHYEGQSRSIFLALGGGRQEVMLTHIMSCIQGPKRSYLR